MDPKETIRLMRLIAARGHKVGYQQRSLDELKALGLRRFPVGTLEHDSDMNQIVCCTSIAPGEALTMPDNVTGLCGWGCGRTIQFRPWVAAELIKVCLYCVAERSPQDS